MRTRKELVEYHLDHGYWPAENDARYGYVLCPKPFRLTPDLFDQLTEVGKAVAGYQRGIAALFDFATKQCGRDRIASVIYQICDQATGGLPLLPGHTSVPITKVDLMIDQAGKIKIAEVDSYNPRGIPFALFLRDIFSETPSPFVGVAGPLTKSLSGNELLWIYAHRERYYLPIFNQMERILGRDNIRLRSLNANDDWAVLRSEKKIIIPWGMNQENECRMRDRLVSLYHEDPEQFIYPLTPWMGTKGLMGVVSNAAKNCDLEAILTQHVDALESIRAYLPESVLLGKRFPEGNAWCLQNTPFVLKKNVASGLKGVWFADANHPEYRTAAQLKRTSYIAQEFVDQKTFPIEYYEPSGECKIADWYLRLTAYIGPDGEVLDAEVTGRQTPDVHGAPDCIMLPCVT